MALVSVITLLLICYIHSGLASEYTDRFEYCSDHFDPSASEKVNYRRITSRNYDHSEYIEKDTFDSIQECFRYTYFNINRRENLTINVSVSSETIDSTLRAVNRNVTKLIVNILPETFQENPIVREDLFL